MSKQFHNQSLDDLYYMINKIYLDRNFHRDRFSTFAHLVEILGGLSLLASDKEKPGVDPRRYIPKAIAWWMALCGKLGIRSVGDMLWQKFPSVCTYCQLQPHNNDRCKAKKSSSKGPDWKLLTQLGQTNHSKRPRTLAEWQDMFAEIYPVSSVETYPATIGRFAEELGELAEALRVAPVSPGYFLSEASDVFAWLMHLQNLIHSKQQLDFSKRGQDLTEAFEEAYPGRCRDCSNPICTCPPILPGTLGRIAHEIPINQGIFMQGGALLTGEEALKLFEIGARVIKLGEREFPVEVELIREINKTVKSLKVFAVENKEVAKALSVDLTTTLDNVRNLVSAHRITQESLDELVKAIAELPFESRSTLINYLAGIGSSVWATALVDTVKHLAG